MKPETLRAAQDRALFESLSQEQAVISVNKQIAKQEKQGPSGTRRRLLATSVRLSKTMAPDLNRIAQECIEKLDVKIPTELYAYNSAQFNAACVKPEDGKLFIMFSSALLDAFNYDELQFVMGHELGHFIYNHHAIPVGYLLQGEQRVSPELALRLTSWSRYAEFSCDRVGAYCVNNFDAVARSLFKLASGVTSNIVKFDRSDFLKQIEDMRIEDESLSRSANVQDWFMTHPFSPLRVKALHLFHQSTLMKANGASLTDLELGIDGLMTFMEPSYLQAKTNEAKVMRNMLFAGVLAIANADQHISAAELAVFEQFFGKHQFSEKLDLDKIKQRIPARAEAVVAQVSVPKRMQLIRDLCIMASCDGGIKESEYQELNEISQLLQVPPIFVEQVLSGFDNSR
ncbi:MAG: M48 family metalloprotease [Cellvibrionaceae bacterium]|nr:M48 family metalloprotease [Cellvibrionaceae bacterium]